jgi:predicted Na+-dependent transporter
LHSARGEGFDDAVSIPVEGIIPNWLLTTVAVCTVFTIMLSIGLEIRFGEFRWVWHRPALILKALFAVLVAVPAIALVVARSSFRAGSRSASC